MSSISGAIREFFWLTVSFFIVQGFVFITLLSYPVSVLRFLFEKCAKVLRPDLGAMLGPEANMFTEDLLSSKPPRSSIVSNCLLQGHYSLSEGLEQFSDMVSRKNKETDALLYPEFKQSVEKWCGFCFWKDDPDFDIKNHVSVYNIDEDTNDAVATPEDVTNLMEHLLNKKFQPNRSPWEVMIVNNYKDPELNNNNNDNTVLVIRTHHTLLDGISLMYAIVEGALGASVSKLMMPKANYVTKKSWTERLGFLMQFPFRMIQDGSNCMAKGFPSHPWKIPDTEKSWMQRLGRSKLVPLDKIKKIKTRLNVSFTSVVLAAVSSGMTKMMRSKAPDQSHRINASPFLLPIPLPGHPNALRNHATAVIVDLPLSDFPDSMARVQECQERLLKQRKSTLPYLSTSAVKTYGVFPSSVSAALHMNRSSIGGLTNFSSGGTKIYFGKNNKNKMLANEVCVGGLHGDAGVVFSTMGYSETLRFTATIEAGLLSRKEVDYLMQLVTDEIDLLYDLVTKPENHHQKLQ